MVDLHCGFIKNAAQQVVEAAGRVHLIAAVNLRLLGVVACVLRLNSNVMRFVGGQDYSS
jgi:mannose/fructose-specific phosphotransferase system component IIA